MYTAQTGDVKTGVGLQGISKIQQTELKQTESLKGQKSADTGTIKTLNTEFTNGIHKNEKLQQGAKTYAANHPGTWRREGEATGILTRLRFRERWSQEMLRTYGGGYFGISAQDGRRCKGKKQEEKLANGGALLLMRFHVYQGVDVPSDVVYKYPCTSFVPFFSMYILFKEVHLI